MCACLTDDDVHLYRVLYYYYYYLIICCTVHVGDGDCIDEDEVTAVFVNVMTRFFDYLCCSSYFALNLERITTTTTTLITIHVDIIILLRKVLVIMTRQTIHVCYVI